MVHLAAALTADHAANVVAAVRASKVVAMVAAVNQEGSSRLSRGEGCKVAEARRRAAKWRKPEGGLQGSGSRGRGKKGAPRTRTRTRTKLGV